MRPKEEIRALLKRLDGEPADALEDESLEFKPWEGDLKTLHRLLREAVVCLANARGGIVVLGIRDGVRTRREAIQGVGRYDIFGLKRAIYGGTDPHILVEIEELTEPEGTLLLVHVPRGLPPHTTSDGMAKVRVGKDCQPLTGRLMAQMLAGGGQVDPTQEIVAGVGEDDLDPKEMVELRQIIRREAQSAELARLGDRPLLESLGLITEHGVTLAGLLLLGRVEALKQHIPQHEVTFLRYRQHTRYDQRRDLKGPLLAVLREMEQLVSINNRIRTVQEEGFGQLEFPDLSWEVAREAVLNAVTHRDYFQRQGVMVELYRDRLEITSPGGFIAGINPDNILRHPPAHRNELLARALHSVGLVNRVGLGVDRIYEELLRLGKDVPRYTADESACASYGAPGHPPGFALLVAQEERRERTLELDDLLILRAFMRFSLLDRWRAAQVLQLSEEEAAERLASLRQRGYLVVRGRGRGASYDSATRTWRIAFRGRAAVDAELPLDEEAVRLRILALLKERGRLSNAEIRRFSGFHRLQVYRLIKGLEAEGKVRLAGKGRSAHIVLSEKP
jgi:ATP-dependent DNA helicase RecG